MLQEQDKSAMRGPLWEVTKGHREEKPVGGDRKGEAGRGDVPALSSESGGLRGGVQLQGEPGAALRKAANLSAWSEGTGGLNGV